MNTYKYKFSYKPLDEIKDPKEIGRILNERNENDFYALNILIRENHNFPKLDKCYCDPNNKKIVFIESKQPASVFDDIVSAFCNASNGKYIASRID